jgi:hypothetical protein
LQNKYHCSDIFKHEKLHILLTNICIMANYSLV